MSRLFKRFKSRCPYCGSRDRYRTGRPRNWKLLPVGRCYVCRNCNSHYIQLFGRHSSLVERGHLLFSACAENFSSMALAHCLGTPFALSLSVRIFQWLDKRARIFPIIGNLRGTVSTRRLTFNTSRNVRSSNANTASVSFPRILKKAAREHETI